MDGGAWWATVHGVTKSQTRLSNFTFFHFASWKKSYDQPRQHILKQRHYFANKGPSSQSYGFPVVMYGCESWTIKKAEHWRIDAFELWCWRRLSRVPWTARRSNQSIIKEISPEYPTPVLLPGKSHGQRSLVGCSPWGREESDTTERLHFTLFIGRTDTEAENPILWLPDVKNWLIVKDPDAGKDWRQEVKGRTEHEMFGRHHLTKGHEFE